MDNSLSNKVAIVVGARAGLGREIALTFARAGASIAACDIVVEDGLLDALVGELKRLGRPCMGLQVDASRKGDVEKMVSEVVNRFGSVDILVNCAAVITRVPLHLCSEEEWDRVINVDLKSYFLCAQAVCRKMIDQRKGNIINVSGLAGISPLKNTGAYPVAKAGVIMLTKQLAWELAEYNIRVNDVCPWFVAAPLSETPRAKWGEQIVASIPLGRMGESTDVASAALFLASEASSWITGHTLVVDGGHLLQCNDIYR